MKQSIDVNWELLGAELANLSDEEQGAFFRGFAIELKHYPSHHAAEMQCCFINGKLTPEQRDFYATIGYEGDQP